MSIFNLTLGFCPAAEPLIVPAQEPEHRRVQSWPRGRLDLGGAVVLVSCVKSKRPHPSPARLLYTSAWFQKARTPVQASGARWFVLSSRYGLVAPDTEIAPYDYTLNTLGVAERRAWASAVLEDSYQNWLVKTASSCLRAIAIASSSSNRS